MNPASPVPPTHIAITEAATPTEYGLFADLVREYAATIDGGLDYQGLEQELASLPGKYAPPGGRLILALVNDAPAGCVALRPLPPVSGEPACEMKRMYVRPAYRGLGLGRLLAERVLHDAARSGYQIMRLDSSETFQAAISLYESLGFRRIPRYNNDPQPCTVWMELRLADVQPPGPSGRS